MTEQKTLNEKVTEKRESQMEKEKKIIKIASVDITAVTGSNSAIDGAFSVANARSREVVFDNEIYNLMRNEHEVGFKENTLQQLYNKFADKDFIGISTIGYNFVEKVVPLVKALKSHFGDTKPIIIGGDQALLNPADCWKLGVDALCFGEAEIDYPVLLENWENRFEPNIRKKIKNFVLNDEELEKLLTMRKKIVEKRICGVALDKIPDQMDQEYQDFSRKNLNGDELGEFPYYFGLDRRNMLDEDGSVVPVTYESMFGFPQHQTPQDKNLLTYAYMRGCINKCDYCYYNTKQHITGQTTFRRLKPGIAIENLKKGKEELLKARQVIIEKGGDAGPEPFLLLMNSDQCSVPFAELKEFCDLYKKEIGIPFYCMNNPNSTTKEKMRELAKAGMVHMDFGVQTNEETNRRDYNRPSSNKRVAMLTQWAKEIEEEEGLHIDILLDFIIYNPFESREDLQKTVEFVKSIGTPYDFIPHTLFLGPDSPLFTKYEEAKKQAEESGTRMDLLNQDCQDEEYSNFHDSYRFYKRLRNNRNFVGNTILEFMAGQINEKMFGRLPRFMKDLEQFDVFEKENLLKVVEKEVKKKHNPNPKIGEEYRFNLEFAKKYRAERESDIDSFLEFISEKIEDASEDQLTIDLLMSDEVLDYFDEHKDLFINIALNMKDLHPQTFTNENPELKQYQYEDEYPDTSSEVNFG